VLGFFGPIPKNQPTSPKNPKFPNLEIFPWQKKTIQTSGNHPEKKITKKHPDISSDDEQGWGVLKLTETKRGFEALELSYKPYSHPQKVKKSRRA